MKKADSLLCIVHFPHHHSYTLSSSPYTLPDDRRTCVYSPFIPIVIPVCFIFPTQFHAFPIPSHFLSPGHCGIHHHTYSLRCWRKTSPIPHYHLPLIIVLRHVCSFYPKLLFFHSLRLLFPGSEMRAIV